MCVSISFFPFSFSLLYVCFLIFPRGGDRGSPIQEHVLHFFELGTQRLIVISTGMISNKVRLPSFSMLFASTAWYFGFIVIYVWLAILFKLAINGRYVYRCRHRVYYSYPQWEVISSPRYGGIPCLIRPTQLVSLPRLSSCLSVPCHPFIFFAPVFFTISFSHRFINCSAGCNFAGSSLTVMSNTSAVYTNDLSRRNIQEPCVQGVARTGETRVCATQGITRDEEEARRG